MRSVLAICFLIALCASVDAAARGHNPKARPVIVRPPPNSDHILRHSECQRLYRDPSVPGGFRTLHDDPPAVNDPSKFGGA